MENSRGSKLLDALASEPLAHVDAVIEGLSRDDTGTETTSEGVTLYRSDTRNESGSKITYPAPLVSLMASLEISWTLNCLTSTAPEAEPVATMVGRVPWVTMATRGRWVFFLGS